MESRGTEVFSQFSGFRCQRSVSDLYNRRMPTERQSGDARLSSDTTLDAEQRQVARWQAMSSVEIAQLVESASQAARELALAGLRARHPEASARELVARLARITLGPELATRVYPELAGLAP